MVLPLRSVMRRDRRRLGHHQLGAGHEDQRREGDPLARARHWRWSSRIRGRSCCSSSAGNAGLRRHLHVLDLERRVVDLDADLVDDRLAELEAVADRPVGLVEEGEGRRGLAIAQPHRVRGLDVGQRRAEPAVLRRPRGSGSRTASSSRHAAASGARPRSDASASGAHRIAGDRVRRHGVVEPHLVLGRELALPLGDHRWWPANCRSRWWRCGPCRGRCRCP